MTEADKFRAQLMDFVNNSPRTHNSDIVISNGIVYVSFEDGSGLDFTEPLTSEQAVKLEAPFTPKKYA